MLKLLRILALALVAPLVQAATTDSIRARNGDLVEPGDSAAAVIDKLGPPAATVSGGMRTKQVQVKNRETNTSRTVTKSVSVEFWTYRIDMQKYILTFEGGRLVEIEWDNL